MPRALIGSSRGTATGRTVTVRNNSILYNGDFEIKPSTITAATNTANRWIDGTAGGSTANRALGWSAPNAGSGVGANGEIGFDTTNVRSGTASLRLSNLTTSGAVTAATFRSNPATGTASELFLLKASTTYTLIAYIKTNNVPTNGAFLDLREYSASTSTLATNSTTKKSGTAGFAIVTLTVTTNASTVFGGIFLRNNVAGNVCDAWFDDITLSTPINRAVVS